MGAAGAVEAALTVLSVEHQVALTIADLSSPRVPGAGVLDPVVGAAGAQRIGLALSNSCGFGGHNTPLAFQPAGCPRTPDRRFALLTGVGGVAYCFRAVCEV
jgi:3-oxoacyl-[acyl-carrier-protein] synthase II